MAVRLFVGNLPYSATEAEIRDLFSAAGPVSSVRLPVDRETGRPRGFAFVEYADRPHAEEAIRRFHNYSFGGRPISVNEARPQERGSAPPPRREGPGGGYGGPRPGGPDSRFSGPRPGGPPGYGPPGDQGPRSPRPGGFSGGPGGPRPGGFERPRMDDIDPDASPDFDAGARRRNFGPDALPKRARKNKAKGGKGDRERVPKGPLSVKGGGRIFYAEDDEDWGEEIDDLESDDLESDDPESDDLESDDLDQAEDVGDDTSDDER